MSAGPIDAPYAAQLLALADASIEHGLTRGRPLAVDPAAYPPALREHMACFVTLHHGGALRGCIGHLEAMQPLVVDVAENAFAAAFRDPRFPPLQAGEFAGLELEISVLTPPERMSFSSEAELLDLVVPFRDGLILEDRGRRGTFLPSVWSSLPDPRDFLRELKRKAGLPADHWSGGLQVSRYATQSISRAPRAS